jgi:hypothetical protein
MIKKMMEMAGVVMCLGPLACSRCKSLIYILATETKGSMMKPGCFPDVCLGRGQRA